LETEKLDILTSVLGSCYKSNDEHLFNCPKCRHDKKKLSVNVEKNVFKCWICDYSGQDIFRLIKRYGQFGHQEEWKQLNGSVDLDKFEDIVLFTKPEEQKPQVVELPDSFKTLTGSSFLDPSSRHALSYLKSRGIHKSDILKWKIGYCTEGEFSNRICIPSFNMDGDLSYFIARTYTDQFPKYKNPPVSRDVVFNDLYVDWDEPITLVEGVFDAIVADNSIPILGSILSEKSKLFQKIIKKNAIIYVALDRDAVKKQNKLIQNLLEYDIKVYKIDTSKHEDVGSMTKEQFKILKKDAAIVNRATYLYQYLKF
jgi:DNA primase